MAKIHWYMTKETYYRYTELLNEMMFAAKDNDKLRYEAAKDAFRALPGFPYQMNPDMDTAVPVIEKQLVIRSPR